MRRRFQGGQPLHRARVRKAVCPDPAIGPGLPGRPFDRVVTVRAFLPVRVEVAIRGVAAANVLHHDRVAARDGFLVNGVAARRDVLSVERAKDEAREPAIARRAIDIRPQHDTVAHPDGDIPIHPGRSGRGAAGQRSEPDQQPDPADAGRAMPHSLDSAATSARSAGRTLPTSNPFAAAVMRVSAAAIGIAGFVSPGFARWKRTGLMRATTKARRYGDLKPFASSDLMILRTWISMSRSREA